MARRAMHHLLTSALAVFRALVLLSIAGAAVALAVAVLVAFLSDVYGR